MVVVVAAAASSGVTAPPFQILIDDRITTKVTHGQQRGVVGFIFIFIFLFFFFVVVAIKELTYNTVDAGWQPFTKTGSQQHPIDYDRR